VTLGMAGTLLSNLFAFCQAVKTIMQTYFDGEEIMFSDLVKSLDDLTKHTKELVTAFNDSVTNEPDDKIDLEVVQQGAAKVAAQRILYLVDMAKADALDAAGEHRAARELAERFLGV